MPPPRAAPEIFRVILILSLSGLLLGVDVCAAGAHLPFRFQVLEGIGHDEAQAFSRDRGEFMFGIDGTMTQALKRYGLKWYSRDGAEADPLVVFGRAGVTWFRMGITTNQTGSMGLEEGLQLARWARYAAYKLDLFFYLSPATADLGKQPASVEWQNLQVEARAQAIREYMRGTVGQFVQNGLSDHVYEIGNEIDYGVAGLFGETHLAQGDSTETISHLADDLWKNEARLLLGAIQGVKEADPQAIIVLHIAHWWNPQFAKAFFDFMDRNDVPFDVMGLSFYPSSGIVSLQQAMQNPGKGDADRSQELLKVTVKELHSMIRKPIIIAEYAYPSTPDIRGMFSWFNKQVSNYPLTPEGQARWITDQLPWAYDTNEILGIFYFQPEFYGPKVADLWQPFSLFDELGRPKPALSSLEEFARKTPELTEGISPRSLILDAWDAISHAEKTGRSVNLDPALSRLREAIALYMDFRYDEVAAPALDAKQLAETSTSQVQSLAESVVGLALLVAIAGSFVLIFRKVRKSRQAKKGTFRY